MNILQTPPRFYPFIGGVENYTYYLSQELVRLGHQVKVICANEPPQEKTETIKGIEINRLSYYGKIANTNLTPLLPWKLCGIECDLIHTHLPTPWSADWSYISAWVKRKPLVVTYHNDIIGEGVAAYWARLYNNLSLPQLLKTADSIIITQPNYLRSSPYLRGYEEKIEIIPNGVDVNRFSPYKDRKEDTIFFLSLLDKYHKYKGLDYLIKAMVKVKQEISDVRLVVGGTGDLKEYYQKLVREKGLESHVEFVGFIPDEQLSEYYGQSSVFILPSTTSKQEGFGIVALEALACETPVITTNIVGVADDLLKTGSGMVIPPKDPDKIAEALIRLLGDRESRKVMGRRGRRLVEEKYTWRAVAVNMEKVYKNILGN